MGLLSRVSEHFVRRVVNDNRGFLGAILPAIGSIAGSAGGQAAIGSGISFGLSKLFGGGGDDEEPTDARTPQQIEAAKMLQSLATTGSGGGINLGEAYTGSLGNFDTTSQEQLGLSQLLGQQPTNQALTQAQDAFSQFSQSSFDPSVLEPFRQAAFREEGAGLDRLAQAKAATGSRFGTGFGRDASSLIEGTNLGLQQQLANLFMNNQQVGLQGAQGLASVGGMQGNMQQNQLQNLFNFGGTERNLANQEAQVKFNEFNRQRGETLRRIGLLETEANRNPYLGVSGLPDSPSPFSELISSVLGGLGGSLGTSISEKGILGSFGLGKNK